MPGLYKIGCTMDLAQRTLQLSPETCGPRPFRCEYAIFAEEYVQLEKVVHQRLNPFRLPRKEFFQCELSKIILELQQASLELVADRKWTQHGGYQESQTAPLPPLEITMSMLDELSSPLGMISHTIPAPETT